MNMKITDQIIGLVLLRGSGFVEGKLRIYNHFKDNSKNDGKDFLKEEYGIGGSSFSFLDQTNFCSEDHSSSGIKIRTSEDELLLSWGEVAKRILKLLQQDKYFTPQEKNIYNIITTKDIVMKEKIESFESVDNFVDTNKVILEGQLCLF